MAERKYIEKGDRLMITFKREKSALIVKIKGEIDSEKAQRLRGKIDVEYEEAHLKNLIFDMSEVSFMDSSGIGMIIGRYKMATAMGGRVMLFGADRALRRILELSGLEKIIKIYESEREMKEREKAI